MKHFGFSEIQKGIKYVGMYLSRHASTPPSVASHRHSKHSLPSPSLHYKKCFENVLLKKDKDMETPTWLKFPFPFWLPEGFLSITERMSSLKTSGNGEAREIRLANPQTVWPLKARHSTSSTSFYAFDSNYTQTGLLVWYSDTS